MCEKQKSELLEPDSVLADTLINNCTREYLDGTGDIYKDYFQIISAF